MITWAKTNSTPYPSIKRLLLPLENRRGHYNSPQTKSGLLSAYFQLFIVTCTLLLALPSCKSTKAAAGSTKATASTYKKYTDKLGFEVDKSCNLKLLDEVIDWWGTPYKYGGETKAGADCSGFVQVVYGKVYNKKLPRTSKEQYEFCKKVNKNQLKEGDLVFFNTSGKGVSHVGIYLKNKYFAHASTKKGVIVNSLDEEYYSKAYISGGRVE